MATAGIRTTAAETLAEIDDVAARIQYSYYTDDVRGIEEALQLLAGFSVEEPLAAARAYQRAYGHWKLAQLLAAAERTSARSGQRAQAMKHAQSCAKQGREALAHDAGQPEMYAIVAACEDFAPEGRGGGSSACARSKMMRRALELAKDNPRVQLVEALCKTGDVSDPAAVDMWRRVVASFEAAPPSRPGRPDWGHVEALTSLGAAHLQRGEPVAARDALERALVLVPDYRVAVQLLESAAARPR